MAAAEARAVWQRTANRCFVQEDAKRAPKLACCQSPSSSTKQVDAGPATAAEGPDHPAGGFMPLNRNPSYSNLPPDAKWWLQMQPSYGHQKDFTYVQLNALEADMETLRAGFVKSTPKTSEVRQQKGECTDADGHKNCKVQKQDVNAQYGEDMKELVQYKDMREKYKIMGMDTIDCPFSKQPGEFCSDYPWIGGGRAEPWWRTTDRDELASLVAQKSLNHIENCDLPPPQKMYHKRHPYADIGCSDHNVILGTSLDGKAQTGGLSDLTSHARCYSDPGITHERKGDAAEEGHSDKSFRDVTETQQLSEGEPTKAQLMEALCHSQTRAREAENAARQAYAEKERILSSFSDKPLNSLPISSGSNCCTWKPFASRLRTTTSQAPLLSQWSFHGCHSKVGNCGGAGVRVPRVKEAGGRNPGTTLPSMLLHLHWESCWCWLAPGMDFGVDVTPFLGCLVVQSSEL